MTVEFIGMIHHRHGSEIHPPPPNVVLDRGYIRDFAQAAEAGGFDKLLVGYFSDAPDGFLVAASAAAHTDRLGFLVAHRPGFVAPTLAARKFATLDQITGGRAAIHVISGGDDADQFRDGDTLDKDERYARTDEYVHILKRIWTEQGPIDHAGTYYRFAGRIDRGALRAAAAHSDLFRRRLRRGDRGRRQARRRLRAVGRDAGAGAGDHRARAGRGGAARTHGAVQPVAAADPGGDRRRGLGARGTHQAAHRGVAGEGRRWGRASRPTKARAGCWQAAAQGERLDKRLWTGAALLTGARGNTTSLVGTPQQVAEALVDYYDLGVTTFLIRGFDPLDDAIEYGRSLLPLTRELIAKRAAAQAAE